MKYYFYFGLDLGIVILSLWVQDRVRVRVAGLMGDPEAASRQREADKPFARVDWIGSVVMPVFLLFRHLPALGWIKPMEVDSEKMRRPRRDALLVALSGPAASLLLSLVSGIILYVLRAVGLSLSSFLGSLLLSICQVNALLGVFNLLPIPPLAGAAAVELFLDGDALTAFEEIKPFGFLLLLAGAYLNFFDFITVPVKRLVVAVLGK